MLFGSVNIIPMSVKRDLLPNQPSTALHFDCFANPIKVFPQQRPKWVEQCTAKNDVGF